MSLKQQLHNYETVTNHRCNESRRFVNFLLRGGQKCKEKIQYDAFFLSLSDPDLKATFGVGGIRSSPINWNEEWCHMALEYLSTHPSAKSQEYSDLIKNWLVAKPCTAHDFKRQEIERASWHRDNTQGMISSARYAVGHSIMDPQEAHDVEIPGTSAHSRKNYIDNVEIPQLQEDYQQYRDRIQQLNQQLQDLGPEPTSDSEEEEGGASNDTPDTTTQQRSPKSNKRKHNNEKDGGDHKRR